MLKNLFGQLQMIGRSLMLPVAVLPVAGLMFGIGNAGLPFIPAELSKVMLAAGEGIFGNMQLMFAVGVALGLSKGNDGAAGLAGLVGLIMMNAALGIVTGLRGLETDATIMGVATLQTGVFGGIIVGAVAAMMYNRFYAIRLPEYLGFFAGKRFVPIVTGLVSIVIGAVLAFAWPPVGNLLDIFSHWAAYQNPVLAWGVYGAGERSLLPVGLHHIWNAPFFFEVGSYTDPQTGKVFTGELTRFFAGDKTAGYLSGGFMYSMWALPAAALAMYHCASPERKKIVGGLMMSAALTSWLTGITEPIEFTFLFVAPILYVIHIFLTGIAFALTAFLEIKHSTDFAHGAIQFFLYYPMSSNAWMFFIIGPIWALLYYGLFRFLIVKLNLKTPGRETEVTTVTLAGKPNEIAVDVVAALGGKSNIKTVDACITRLRVSVREIKHVDVVKLKQLGAREVIVIGDNLQAIFGTQSDTIKSEIHGVLASA
ncbi:phosphotransferase system glucose-specific IIBC component [Vibrio sp. RC586]|uniref:glucose-specific PTS transporter subunit IIBC n=1 Tax=Vibrio sp. RC586 TaxID=675815 RepID=UPI0001BB7BCD|nr:glucose-specific PTS transporter subunit IIBC [Vibrio sp. RC586]EEY98387.1 phosphotransferase system glucose-specific IIBC component [Vibrio sp. RC586]